MAIARYWHTVKPDAPDVITGLLGKAISSADDIAVIECVVLTVVTEGVAIQPSLDTFFVPAMQYLTAKRDTRWIHGVWFRPEARPFFSGLSAEHTDLVLQNLLTVPKVDSHVERILCYIAGSHNSKVWDFFGKWLSIDQEPNRPRKQTYEAIPYQFHGLEEPLSKDAILSIDTARSWYRPDDHLSEFRGAQLLSAVFQSCRHRSHSGSRKWPKRDRTTISTSSLPSCASIRADPRRTGLKAIIGWLSEDDQRLRKVGICPESTGVVAEQFGFVDAYRAKKTELKPWLQDENAKIKAFAARFTARLDQRIASEQRLAEDRLELRKREYDAGKSAA